MIYRGKDRFWEGECPSLPGCVSQGETPEQAVLNIKEAMEGYILALKEDRLPVPEESFDAVLVGARASCRNLRGRS